MKLAVNIAPAQFEQCDLPALLRSALAQSGLAPERLKLEIARLRREKYGPSSERAARIEQLELSLEALEETAAEVSVALAKMMPSSKLVELDTGHLAMLEQPAAIADVIRQRI